MMFYEIILKFIFIISVYSNYLIPLFNSPESFPFLIHLSPRVRWAIVIMLCPLTVCPSIRLFQKSSPLKPLNHLLQNFVQMITRVCIFTFVRIVSIYIKDVHTNWVWISITFFPRYRMLKLVIFCYILYVGYIVSQHKSTPTVFQLGMLFLQIVSICIIDVCSL
jgi:hypothetical protein